MRFKLMLLALALPVPAMAQGQWESFQAEGWTGARVCPFGEIAEGGYFCLELACPDGGPLGFRVRLTEAEVQPVVEAMWTVNLRDAGGIVMAPLEDAPGQYYAPYDADRDARLIERLRNGREGSFTIVNRPIRAVRPFTLEGSFGPIGEALEACPLAMPLEEAATPAPDDMIEVIPADPEDLLVVVPAAPPVDVPPDPHDDSDGAGPEAPPVIAPEAEPEAPAVAAPDADPETAPEAAAGSDPDDPAAAERVPEADSPPAGPLVAEDGSVSDPAALVLQEIEGACAERGGGFVEVREDFVRREDFDGDGIPDMEVSYSGAVCDAAAGLYCDTASCLTRLYLGREDGRFVPAFEDVYMSARQAPAFVVTYDAGSPACPEAQTPCDRVFIWQDGALIPVEPPQP
ncbi:hypothetical protein [Histidinibacterium lentulum]|uniref:Uncharacterized protein n=1 Tax=Histidinibacterium lentulum TaxID=2480588 RepID=A0A3N2R836_9RHOB|nr:hypothetical protein [Histidinibacterium lentulum]ROU03578.1 hypothetical protein EAT49_04590 [Histidinibacterium lentulum]